MRDMQIRDRGKVLATIAVYMLFMMYYCNYVNAQPGTYQYGIPGADMLAHFQGAKALSEGRSWTELAFIGSRFEEVGISTIGYFIYTTFLAIALYVLPIFSVGINVYLVYVFQIIISVDACIRYNRFYRKNLPGHSKMRTFFILATCIPFAMQATQLMRDIYYMWFISILLEKVTSYREISKATLRDRRSKRIVKRVGFWLSVILLSLICICMRFYSAIVFVPLLLYYTRYKKLGVYSSLTVSAVLLVGLGFIELIRGFIGGATWAFSPPNLGESIQFLLFPQIFSQSEYILNWGKFFTSIDVSGCNVPGVYYAMAVWNTFIFPLALFGLLSTLRRDKMENILWGTILLNIVLLYSISYDSIDTRHKFFMMLPLSYFANKGIICLNCMDKRLIWFYCVAMISLFSVVLFISI